MTRATPDDPEGLGALEPRIIEPLPDARMTSWVDRLARTECPALTARRARRSEAAGAPHDPIVWERARGANVLDACANVYVDLTAGFGVAALGHTPVAITRAISEQASKLTHALGDVHPSEPKIMLLEQLQKLAPFDDARVVLGLSGADAVEAAVQTAWLTTKRAGVLAFEGGYHGLSLGALVLSGYKETFRSPFAPYLHPHVAFAPYPKSATTVADAIAAVARVMDSHASPIGAVLVEPMLGRGGLVVPPPGFLRALSELAHARGALFVVDEIFTGLGRAGERWLSSAEGARPDVLCIGKALGGGLPMSACMAPRSMMEAWGSPSGEALRTSTFLGNPLGCAAALACLDAVESQGLAARAREVGARFLEHLRVALANAPHVVDIRGRGLAIGVELDSGARTLRVVQALLARGYITLPAGSGAEVLQLTPPLTIDEPLLVHFVETLATVLGALL